MTGPASPPTSFAKQQPATLSRDLGVSHAAAIVVGTIIGSGIFLVPAEMMQAVGSAWLVYLAWIVGGVLSLAGAITYAELGAMKPQAGGEYVYIRDAYGPLPGIPLCLDVVRHRQACFGRDAHHRVRPHSRHLSRVRILQPALLSARRLPSATDNWSRSPPRRSSPGLNYIGIKRAGDFQVVFTLLKIAIIVAVALLAFTAVKRHVAQLRNHLRGRHRRLRRIHGRAGRGAVGLRRMERPQHGERRNPQSRNATFPSR